MRIEEALQQMSPSELEEWRRIMVTFACRFFHGVNRDFLITVAEAEFRQAQAQGRKATVKEER